MPIPPPRPEDEGSACSVDCPTAEAHELERMGRNLSEPPTMTSPNLSLQRRAEVEPCTDAASSWKRVRIERVARVRDVRG
jgi:hypothetical protein